MSQTSKAADQMSRATVRLHVVEAIRGVLVRDLIPALASENDAATGHLIIRLLDFLGEEAHADAPSFAGRSGLPQPLVDELNALVAADQAAKADDLNAIGRNLASVLQRTDRGSKTQPEASFVRKLAAHEIRSLDTLDSHGQGGIAETYAKGMVKLDGESASAKPAVLSEASLRAALRRSEVFGPEFRVSALSEIPGGFNKLTASFVLDRGQGEERMILRRDAVPNPTGFSVVNEFPVLKAVWRAGVVPMAEPLLVERDAAAIGSPFLVVRRMPGSTDISQWRDEPAAGRALAQELARSLAHLHAIDVRSFLPEREVLKPVASYIAEEINGWYQRSLRWRIRPSPALDAGYAWMRANIPPSDRKPVLVHGDVGFHNMLMDQGHLTALLDWEFSHIGDPMEDLNYCRPFVTAVCDWSVFLDAYHEAGGVPFDMAAEPFFELWPSLRNGSGCDALMRTFLENPGSDLKFAVAGTQHVRRYENAVLEFLGRQPT